MRSGYAERMFRDYLTQGDCLAGLPQLFPLSNHALCNAFDESEPPESDSVFNSRVLREVTLA